MPVSINVKAEVKGARKYLKGVQKKVIPRATNAALNKAIRKTKTEVRRHISKETGIKPQKKVNQALDIVKSNFRTLTARLIPQSLGLNLIEFVTPAKRVVGAFRKKAGVVAKAWNERKVYRNTFIGKGRNSGKPLVYSRTSEKPYPIEAKSGPSIPREFVKKKAEQIMDRVANAAFVKEFRRELKFRLSKLK
jgi:hypothetical protein